MGSVLFCPKCGAKMAEERRRVMHCPACGFKAHRDNVSVI
ncbi:zinc ribbon domain-containing protein [Pyrobaculum islandicum]